MKILLRQLHALRRREWLYFLLRGLGRVAVLVAVLLTAMCLLDYAIDRSAETPYAVRVGMLAAQIVVYAVAVGLWLIWLRVPGLVALAGRVEERLPEFDHRLVTTLQLHHADARTEGMSQQLIGQVHDESEELSRGRRLSRFARHGILKWAMVLIVPVLLYISAIAAWQGPLVKTLLARQLLLDRAIPRNVRLENDTQPVYPVGESATIRVIVFGPIDETIGGTVAVMPTDQPSEEYELVQTDETIDGGTLFTATIPPSSANFTFQARVWDGRLPEPGHVEFVPRPVVDTLEADMILPKYIDPEGEREYRRIQPQAEVLAWPDATIAVRAKVSKPIREARLVLTDRESDNGVSATIDMTLSADGTLATGQFQVPEVPGSYRIEVVDQYGFKNLHPPRRGIVIMNDVSPEVELLPEVLKAPSDTGPLEQYDASWMPLLLNGNGVPVAWRASSPFGIDEAYLIYRVHTGETVGAWQPLPLTPTTADENVMGEFIPELGLFEQSATNDQIEFYSIPSTDPENEPPGLRAGGRVNFRIKALTKQRDGKDVGIEIGDVIEIKVAAYDRKPAERLPVTEPPEDHSSASDAPAGPRIDPRRRPGWSASMFKRVVTLSDFLAAEKHFRDQTIRLRELEESQRSVFQAEKPTGQ